MLVEIGNMRGVDVAALEFDFDQTWAALFMNSEGAVLGRYGSRDARARQAELSFKGLRYALEGALARHRAGDVVRLPSKPRRAEDFAEARKLAPQSCIHCHNIHEFQRQKRQAAGLWHKDEVWMYPEPGNIGLALDVDQGNLVLGVRPGSAAEKAGLRAGDVLLKIGKAELASIADVRYALHHAPAEGELAAEWKREGRTLAGVLKLTSGWRVSDVSWRWSNKSLGPTPPVQGLDLTAEERGQLGVAAGQLAFRQGPFLSQAARQAGMRINDVILGVDGKSPDMSAGQFEIYFRLRYRSGDTVTYDVLRGGARLKISVKLP